MLILMDSLFTDKRTQFTNTIFKQFESSIDAKQNFIPLTLETINLPDVVRQSDGHSCENFVCVYFYVESILLIKYFTKDDWLVSFKDMVKKHINAERTIMDF